MFSPLRGLLPGTPADCRIGPGRVAELAWRANFKRVGCARHQTWNADGGLTRVTTVLVHELGGPPLPCAP